MFSLRLRLIGLFVILALVVAAVMIVAVQQFSSEQVMHLAVEAGSSPEQAQAMFDEAVGRVLLIGAVVGLLVGMFAGWWLLRRILLPLERLTNASRAIAWGDLATRVPAPPDPELRGLADAFNQMAATLERMDTLRRALVEDVAHELRTPLTSLRGYTEALADGVVEPTPDMLRTVHEEIVRLGSLVEGLDQLARGEAGPRAQALAEVDLAAVVTRAVALVSPELARRRISVELDDGEALPRLLAEPGTLDQVVSNLMQNAVRYTDGGGSVTVRLRAENGWIRCAVANTGSEIPELKLPLIWERLHRVDPSRDRASGGAGIGLAIVRQIVESLGGRVGAESANGRTEVWFELPIAG